VQPIGLWIIILDFVFGGFYVYLSHFCCRSGPAGMVMV